MATYAIGDIQGCYDELINLLQLIKYNELQDHLWLAGDLVNRGPNSLEVLRYLYKLPIAPKITLGNHDLHLLAVDCDAAHFRTNKDTFQDVLAAPDRQHLCHWLRQQPLVYYDKNLNYLMVHAGIAKDWDYKLALSLGDEVSNILKSDKYYDFLLNMYGDTPNHWDENLTGWARMRVITNIFTRMRFCDKHGNIDLQSKSSLGTQSPHLIPWFNVPNRKSANLNIIFGHWASLRGKTDKSNIFALDTGCVWGGKLTAMRLEDQKIFAVNSLQTR